MAFITVVLLKATSGNIHSVVLEGEDNEAWYGKSYDNRTSRVISYSKEIYKKV